MAGLIHVDMGKFAIADIGDVGLQHGGGDMAMKIKRHGDGCAGLEFGAHPAHDFGLGIGFVFQDHGAMQGQKHPVHRQDGAQALDNLVHQNVKTGALHRARRHRHGGQQRQGRCAGFPAGIQRARNFQPRAAKGDENIRAAIQILVLEGLHRGGEGHETVGLLLEFRNGDAHGTLLQTAASRPRPGMAASKARV